VVDVELATVVDAVSVEPVVTDCSVTGTLVDVVEIASVLDPGVVCWDVVTVAAEVVVA